MRGPAAAGAGAAAWSGDRRGRAGLSPTGTGLALAVRRRLAKLGLVGGDDHAVLTLDWRG